jgi:acyl-CoA dehydrogenase
MTENDVQKLAKLARIRLTDEECSLFSKNFDEILQYVELVRAVAGEMPEAKVGRAPTSPADVRPGYRSVSNRGYRNFVLAFDRCRVPGSQVLGEEHRGFEVANTWLSASRLQVAATCLGRADRAIGIATEWAANRRQFGQPIGRFQGVSFKLADMLTRLAAAELLTYRAAWRADKGTMTDSDAAMAKLAASEMLAFVTDEAIQVLGGMGLMDELPLERLWRDARVERIWDGTSEIQRHIISRTMLRARGG